VRHTIIQSVREKIYAHGRSWVFTPQNFLDLNSSTGVRTALSRLEKEKVIRRLTQGIYDYPVVHPSLGVLSPSIDAVARAFAEKNGAKLQVSGAYAANLLGLSEQVPGKIIFLTDGPSGVISLGKSKILFKKTTIKNMHAAGTKEALVIQSFKFMKEKNITPKMLEATKAFLKDTPREVFEENIKFAPYWIRVILVNLKDAM
jgi:hypothetical protein